MSWTSGATDVVPLRNPFPCFALILLPRAAHRDARTFSHAGKLRRVPGRQQMFHKLKDYKRVMVRVAEEGTFVESSPAAGAAEGGKAELR